MNTNYTNIRIISMNSYITLLIAPQLVYYITNCSAISILVSRL